MYFISGLAIYDTRFAPQSRYLLLNDLEALYSLHYVAICHYVQRTWIIALPLIFPAVINTFVIDRLLYLIRGTTARKNISHTTRDL